MKRKISSKLKYYMQTSALREKPRQINVILQQKLLVATLSAVCAVYKQ